MTQDTKYLEGQINWKEYETGNTKHTWDLEKIKSEHKILKEYDYELKPIDKGFAKL